MEGREWFENHLKSTIGNHVMTNRIRERREKQGISQRELAARVGLDHRTISNFERDRTSPKICDLVKISNALGTRLVDLLPAELLKPPRAA